MHCSAENGLKNTDTSSGKIWGKMPRKKWGPERQCMASSREADPTEIASTAPTILNHKDKMCNTRFMDTLPRVVRPYPNYSTQKKSP